MEAIFEGLVSFVVELVFEVVGEVLVELGFHALAASIRSRTHPVLSVAGYTFVGAALGGLSVLVRPAHLIHDPLMSAIYLIFSPVVAGLVMAGIGALRARRGQALLRLDSFGCGYLFALAFALVRWQFAG